MNICLKTLQIQNKIQNCRQQTSWYGKQKLLIQRGMEWYRTRAQTHTQSCIHTLACAQNTHTVMHTHIGMC